MSFVAGLLEPPHSSAYWIYPSGWRLICRKMSLDHMGHYSACTTNYDTENPFLCGDDLCVGVLLCNDIAPPPGCSNSANATQRRNELFENLRNSKCRLKVLCIPAHMKVSDFLGGYGGEHRHPLLGIGWIALANSRAGEFDSFIANPRGEKTKVVPVKSKSDDTNRIEITNLYATIRLRQRYSGVTAILC